MDLDRKESLYKKLGGETAIDQVVQTFYKKVLADARIKDFFNQLDMEKQIIKQKAFLSMVLGGPNQYSGRSMRVGHRHLVEKGLNDGHVDAVVQLLGEALTDHGVAPGDVVQVQEIANSVRDDVLNRPKKV